MGRLARRELHPVGDAGMFVTVAVRFLSTEKDSNSTS